MAHTTIINGTIYEKSKGKDLAGGTVYEKDHGKTLVGGTVYEVGFAPEFDGFVYLRPSADISVDSTLTFTPSDIAAAYMLINEEVSDGATTCLSAIATADNIDVQATAKFRLDGYIPEQITKVNNINLFVSATTSELDTTDSGYWSTGYIWVRLYFGEYKWYASFSDSAISHGFEGSDYTPLQALNTEDLLSAVNAYIADNGVLPSIELEIGLSAERYGESNKYSYGYAEVSQAYIILECE